jgi:hypothetical protein
MIVFSCFLSFLLGMAAGCCIMDYFTPKTGGFKNDEPVRIIKKESHK